MYASRVNASATLPGKEASLAGPRGAENQIHRDKDDGLAAILAAKIRTKAELKQVLLAVIVIRIIAIDCRLIFLFLFRSGPDSLRKQLLRICRLRRKVIVG